MSAVQLKIKAYYQLVKPRMVFANVFVAAAVFVFASHDTFSWQVFFYMVLGLSLVVASACVFNNHADRFLDAKMERTKNRALATGNLAPKAALWFGSILFVLGICLLLFVSPLALGAALLGFFVYVFLYTPLKSKTGYALYVGAIAGATPPLVGYASGAGTLDYYALGFFLILFLWQIPHFLAIARFRYDEYTAGDVPLLVTRPENEDQRKRARKIFHYSLVFLLLFCLALILQR